MWNFLPMFFACLVVPKASSFHLGQGNRWAFLGLKARRKYIHTELGPKNQGLSYPQTLGSQHGNKDYKKDSSPIDLAGASFSLLAKKGRSWKRLRHAAEIAVKGQEKGGSAADIGTDHGLLVFGLALSEHYCKVFGVDISENALNDGALKLRKEVEEHCATRDISANKLTPIEFRVGDGLLALHPGEADTVCIAGMGVHTMMRVLSCRSKPDGKTMLEELGTRQLVLQPTNSRPRNLVLLYDFLQNSGWRLKDERIEYLSSRWYLSSGFCREETRSLLLPAEHLLLRGKSYLESGDTELTNYVEHHKRWIFQDREKSGKRNAADDRWLAMVTKT